MTATSSSWIRDWLSVQEWVHGIRQTLGTADTVTVSNVASDGYPTVLGYDLRNEPHTPARTAYTAAATWGSGDGIDPAANPNPNPFAPSWIASSTCKDWRLAAERAGTKLLGAAAARGWDYPLIFVEGISMYPRDGGTQASGPYDGTWWGGELRGVNGNRTNAGAPVVLNAGGDSNGLGPAVDNQLVCSAHEYGPTEFVQPWENSTTCYKSGCGGSSLADVWYSNWAYLTAAAGVSPVWPGHGSYPWANTGHTGYSTAPMFVGELGTGNAATSLTSTTRGSQGQWFTDFVSFLDSSRNMTAANDSGTAVSNLHWAYWALNDEDGYALLGANYTGLENPTKEYSYNCFLQWGPLAVPRGTGAGQCGSTGPLLGQRRPARQRRSGRRGAGSVGSAGLATIADDGPAALGRTPAAGLSAGRPRPGAHAPGAPAQLIPERHRQPPPFQEERSTRPLIQHTWTR